MGARRPIWPRLGRGLVRLLGLCVLAVGTWYCLEGLNVQALWGALGDAQPYWLLAGACINFANMGLKSLGWDLLLPPGSNVPRWAMFRYTVATGALNLVMPLKAGEAVRIFQLTRRHRVPISALVTVAAIEKVLDVITLLLLLAPLPLCVSHLPGWVLGALKTCTVSALVGVTGLLAWLVLQPPWGGPIVRAATVQARALGSKLCFALVLVGLSWCVDWLLIVCVLHALHIDVAPILGLLVLFVLNLAIAIPSTPGQMGVLELGASTGLMALGVPQDRALAFGLLYHAAQAVPLLAYLALDHRFVWRMLGSMRAAQAQRPAPPR